MVVSVDEHARGEMWLRKSECCGASYVCIGVSVDEHAREDVCGSGKVSVVIHHTYALLFQLMNMQERMYVAKEK